MKGYYLKNCTRFWIVVFSVFVTLPAARSFAQEELLYMPVDVRKAYDNNTRSYKGKPGDEYWQNRSDYQIKAEWDPQKHLLLGNETINYYNNSPDSLKRLIMRLYQDRYKKGNMRDFPVDTADVHQGTNISYLKINGEQVTFDDKSPWKQRYGTTMGIDLDQPLPPGEQIELEIGWQTFIPGKSFRRRMGAFGDSSAFIAYWYPEIAVYDDVDGWDLSSHTGEQEFYHDFGNYEVEITVPGNFIVWATGLLQNAEEVLQKKYFYRYEEAFESDSIIHIVTAEDYADEPITSQNDRNIWRFEASNVPDFAFATSNCFLWDGSSIIVDKENERRVMVDVAYNRDSNEFYDVAEISRKTIEYLSFKMPGVPFPYPKLTIYNGGIAGGMEFPMMVNNGRTTTMARTVGLTAHEITHTYFPFYMGTNEKKYAWMDEGWAVMIPFDFRRQMVEGNDPLSREIVKYELLAGREMDMPLMTPSLMMQGSALRMASYNRPAIAYVILKNIMGAEKFREALKTYIDRWNGKHPLPYDFFFTFNEVNTESLNWFWNPWFFDRGYPDLAIGSVQTTGGKTEVMIKKIGQLPVPVNLRIKFADGNERNIDKSADVWKNGDTKCIIHFEHIEDIVSIDLGNAYIPDQNHDNNRY